MSSVVYLELGESNMNRNLFSLRCSKQKTCSGELLDVVQNREVGVEKITKTKQEKKTQRG